MPKRQSVAPKRVLLLYSGGLDTSCMLKWIPENYGGAEVVTLTLDLGQGEDLQFAHDKALKLGAVGAHIVDATQRFAGDFLAPAVRANALYQGKYPLATALARPLIAEIAVDIARETGCDTIAHGCTGKGNDQVRFEVSINALASHMNIIAPIREWDMSRDTELEYAKSRDIPLPADQNVSYSVDANLWGRSIEAGILEDVNVEPPADVYSMINRLEDTPNTAEYVEIGLEKGLPVSLNGRKMTLVDVVTSINATAGRHGIGFIDMVEDRVVGLKSREIYEAPAAVVLIKAHQELEGLCSTIHQNEFKRSVDQKWGELVYKGLWHEPLRENLQAFIESANEHVTGTVKLKLYKGQAQVVGRSSDNALYDKSLISYESGHTFDQEDSVGFISLWGLPTRSANLKKLNKNS